ncbi:rhomboid family intramembrane serine protease [Subtercola sp. YIM 133946]|uniref:rhomboid family intramembrane serine protease n=1 Tax=Subtercola sp. YIM 133946 TaxID=3118909 RepID=UPI002F95FE13
MTSAPYNPDNFCYRHPDRQSFVLCQRCGRTICPQCQVQAAVGVHCVECARSDRKTPQYRRPPRLIRSARASVRSSDAPVVTYSIMGVTVLIWLLNFFPSLGITQALLYAPVYSNPAFGHFEPWRMLTYAFVQSPFTLSNPLSIINILFTMFSLYIFGRLLEPMLGRWQFALLYVLSALGGALAVAWLASPTTAVIGATGAIFGLIAGLFFFARRQGGNMTQLLVLVGLNLVLAFIVGGVWQVYVGGLVVGALTGLIYAEFGQRRQRTTQRLLLAALAVLTIVLTVVRP